MTLRSMGAQARLKRLQLLQHNTNSNRNNNNNGDQRHRAKRAKQNGSVQSETVDATAIKKSHLIQVHL